ncbi:NAD(P)/FAD-dependent oxidoreductase [Rhodococcus sp. 14-1411-2a]|uniref:NAD(P)/FAD-dependent oxidoreductase n=1 Tax=Rhodococcus sp. 14-1411-2a TaxID=2023151 RepID=UPI000B9B0A45|nr:FAD-dependent oxidoreductase [Rhodococcus sp. 14-1411-2a]OZF47840.1 pyridine nucleotide-disulfide oxidoreductase [Rhodococcus sp. 14-1411-2a]
MSAERAVIIGASHAGAQLAAHLRREKWAGEIVLIGDEGTLPYQRPPLSKAYLAGTSTLEAMAIRGADFYDKQNIELVDGSVSSIDREARTVTFDSGVTQSYSKLALCTGARTRRLATPGADLAGIHYLRTAADSASLRSAATPGTRVVVVGGGYIGLETAASLRASGLDVTVVEAAERVLERVTAPVVSTFFTRIHREAGVEIRTGALVEEFRGDSRVRAVVLAGGDTLPADLVVIGVGIVPNTELAEAAGITVDNGIVIDDRTRTDDLDIVAAGDCAAYHVARYSRRVRLEGVCAANEHAKVAASTLTGGSSAITALPWFWSDQYDLKLQIAGLGTGYDEVVVNGDPERDRDFTCYYLRDGQLIAADCINRPRDFMTSKKKIAEHSTVELAELIG